MQILHLVGHERIGRELAKLIAKNWGRRVPYSTLYLHIERLRKAGLVKVRTDTRKGRPVRYVQITGDGAKVRNQSQDFYRSLADPVIVDLGEA